MSFSNIRRFSPCRSSVAGIIFFFCWIPVSALKFENLKVPSHFHSLKKFNFNRLLCLFYVVVVTYLFLL